MLLERLTGGGGFPGLPPAEPLREANANRSPAGGQVATKLHNK